MKQVILQLDPAVALFYSKIADRTGKTLEQVIHDALFRLAGELSLNALRHQQ